MDLIVKGRPYTSPVNTIADVLKLHMADEVILSQSGKNIQIVIEGQFTGVGAIIHGVIIKVMP